VLNNPLSYTDPTGYECNNRIGAPIRDCVYGMEDHSNSNGNTDTSGGSDHRDVNSANRSDGLSNSAARASGEMPTDDETTCGYNCPLDEVFKKYWKQIAIGAVGGVSNQSPLDAAVSEFFGAEQFTEGAINIVEGDIVDGGMEVASAIALGKFKQIKKQADRLLGGDSNALVPKKANPLDGTTFTDKVKRQMNGRDTDHNFPTLVDKQADAASVKKITGGDGVERTKVELPGSINGKDGNFSWIIEPDKTINHRQFERHKKK